MSAKLMAVVSGTVGVCLPCPTPRHPAGNVLIKAGRRRDAHVWVLTPSPWCVTLNHTHRQHNCREGSICICWRRVLYALLTSLYVDVLHQTQYWVVSRSTYSVELTVHDKSFCGRAVLSSVIWSSCYFHKNCSMWQFTHVIKLRRTDYRWVMLSKGVSAPNK